MVATPLWSGRLLLSLLAGLLLIHPAYPVKHENFKTCAQSGFCARNRAHADTAAQLGSAWTSPYTLDHTSLALTDGVLAGTIRKTVNATSGEKVRLPLRITFLESGVARVTVDEERRRTGQIELRHGSKARKERYDGVEGWAIAGGMERSKGAAVSSDAESGTTRVVYGPGGRHEAIVRHQPFGVEFSRDGEVQVRLNERGLMNVEHWRAKVERVEGKAEEKVEENGEEKKEGEEEVTKVEEAVPHQEPLEDTWWDEKFGGNTDSKPRGPESIGIDVTFPGYEHVYGIPGHTGPLSLKQTRKKSEGDDNWEEPYRLYNSDVFEYEMDSPMTLYGSIPLMQAHKKGSTVGIFWMNAAETWVDIVKDKSTANKLSLGTAGHVDAKTHWFSESGLLDLFVFLGPTPASISNAYGELTGYTTLPQSFAIAYHQCRWNYITDADVRDVDRKFDRAEIPYDIIWLDLEYLDDRKWFTWEPLSFSDPVGMQKQLAEHERKLVVLIDPHIKNQGEYFIHKELMAKELAVNDKDGKPYEGWCWPGNSHWVDCFNPAGVTWWKSLFAYKKFTSSLSNLFIWNDMNEPSVFSGPETTMPKDNLHHGNWEHRDVHNLNGLTFHNATYQGLLERDSPRRRPFVLTRSFYSGSQRLGAMWTGDNQAEWSHLKASLPMVLSMGISGYPFAGADVGGFFGNPSKELLTRWYQAGVFYPFFRAHAHIDTRRREPYLLGEPYTGIITQAIRLRYSLLPAWYTAFHKASTHGYPIVRPNWWVYPDDPRGFELDDQMYLGDTGLLVKPVTEAPAEPEVEVEGDKAVAAQTIGKEQSVDIYLAAGATYYDYWDYHIYAGAAGRHATIAAPLDTLPLLMESGHIFPRRDRPRRSSGLMKRDPFTLVVVLDQTADTATPSSAADGEDVKAVGSLYLDDGESFDHTAGAYIHRTFTAARDTAGVFKLMSSDASAAAASKPGKKTKEFAKTMADVVVERVIVVGAPAKWSTLTAVGVTVEGGAGASSSAEARRHVPMEFHAASQGRAAWAVVKNPRVAIGEGWRIDFA